ncbi:MAG: glycosyltransferase family 39 protein [Oscillospiraceae bacterium]|nr:glycosyltransferase family 39 protein [Oscillospiraceae bacterium]
MEKVSDILKKIMLGILLGIILLTLALMVREGLTSKSYLAALVVGAAWAAALLYYLRRREKQGKACFTQNISANKLALGIAIFCFVINLIWVIAIRIEPFSDYDKYWQVAISLATGREIEDAWYIAMYPHILGTASFLSIFVRIFGQSVLMVTVLNVLLTALSGLIVFYICLEIADKEIAAMASLLWAICPCKLMLNSLVFSEPLYTCLILLFLLAFIKLHGNVSEDRSQWWVYMVEGALLGFLLQCINIVRPIAGILIIALFIWLIMLRGEELKKLKLWRSWAFVLLPLVFFYSGTGNIWTSHVAELVGMEPAAVPIYNIYVGFNETTQGQWSADDMDLLFEYLSQPGVSPSQAQESLLPLLKERLTSGIDYAKLFSSKLIAFMGNDELGGYTYRFTRPVIFVKLGMVVGNVFYYGILLLAVYGLCRMFRGKFRSSALLLPLYVLGLTLAHMLVEVANRYHYSIIPMLIIFAALAFSRREKT